MPSRVGITQAAEPQSKGAPEKPLAHDMKAFRKGQQVRVTGKPGGPVQGWSGSWNPTMDRVVGKTCIIERNDRARGFCIRPLDNMNDSWSVPSTSLERVRAKRRVRVGPGPWDAAPCPHLRWNLMAFFRDKLTIVGKAGDRTTIKCEKCDVTMTLEAKGE